MGHSGSSNGKRWRIIIKEKFGCVEATIFDSGKFFRSESWLRPSKADSLEENFKANHSTFDFEGHALKAVGKTFNRPLFFKKKDKK